MSFSHNIRCGLRTLRSAASVLALCVLAAVPAWAKATLTTFKVENSTDTQAMSVNSDGAVTGFAYDLGEGFVRAADGSITTFKTTGTTFATAINDSGEVAGYYDENGTHAGAFLRDAQGTITTFNPGGTPLYPVVSINDEGEIAGSFNHANGDYYGFVRAPDGTITTFGLGVNTFVAAINSRGMTAGGFLKDKVEHGFIRKPDGHIVKVDVPSSIGTELLALDRAGAAAGDFEDSSRMWHGFVRAADGTVRTFDPPGSTCTLVSGIDESGRVVGWYMSGEYTYGFLRHRRGGISTFMGYSYISPSSINHSGAIVGTLQLNDGRYQGFIRTP